MPAKANIKRNAIKSKSGTCKICNRKYAFLGDHVRRVHEIGMSEYNKQNKGNAKTFKAGRALCELCDPPKMVTESYLGTHQRKLHGAAPKRRSKNNPMGPLEPIIVNDGTAIVMNKVMFLEMTFPQGIPKNKFGDVVAFIESFERTTR